MLPDRLVTMANQIGIFFASQSRGPDGEQRAVEEIANHLRRFWDPRMRNAIVALPPQARAGLNPLPRRAVEMLAHGPRDTMPEEESTGG